MNDLAMANLQAQEWQRRAKQYRLARSVKTQRRVGWPSLIKRVAEPLLRDWVGTRAADQASRRQPSLMGSIGE